MTTPHTEMHFGPSWMQNSSRAKSYSKQAAPASTSDDANGATPHPSALSYSSVIRDQAALANGPPVQEQPGFADAAHPFRYSKGYMLGLWSDNKDRELPIEFERWEVIFRPDGGMPAGLKDMDEVEKRAFGMSYNPDRRPTASTVNSSASLATLADLKLDQPARRRQVTGGTEALNSPVRERFGGIQGGVLGGLGGGAKEPFVSATGAAKGTSRRKDEASAPLPPSSTNSWRPTRALSSNLPTAEPTTPSAETASADGRRWRSTTEEPAAAAQAADRGGVVGGGFNASASRAGGWRERERMKKAEGELSSSAGWTSVDKADGKKARGAGLAADDKAGEQFSNAYSALDQDEQDDSSAAQADVVPAAPQPSQEQLEKDALKLVNWTYKDPSGNVQGPFPAQNMHDWNAQGYFAPSLLVKRESDASYETVATLTLLSPDPNEIFFQRPAVKAPAPPGLMPTAAQMLGLGAVSTPLVSPLVGFADPAVLERNPVDQFMQQGVEPAARWAGLGTPTRQNAQPFGNGLAQQSPYQQHSQPAFDPAAQLYNQRTPARHPFQDATPFGMAAAQSPYASPLVQHHAVAPWNQPQVAPAPQPFFGTGGPHYGNMPGSNAGFGYPGMGNVGLSGSEPWAASGLTNDWRNPMSPGGQNLIPQQQQQQQQQQMSYAQDLMGQQGLQHQQHQQQHQQQMWPPAAGQPQQTLAPGPIEPAAETSVEQDQRPVEPTPDAESAIIEAAAEPKASPEPEPIAASSPKVSAAPSPSKAIPAIEKPAAAAAPSAPVTKVSKAEARKAAAAAAAAAAAVAPAESIERAAQSSPAPKVAPWAKLEEEAAMPSPSLREIQQAEAIKAAASAPKKAAQQPSEAAPKSSSPMSTTTVSWGLNGTNTAKVAPVVAPAPATSPAPAAVWQTSSSTPSKTLKQIQEEEARQKARAAQLKAAQSASLGSAAAKAAYAGALSTAAAQSNAAASAWSTVGSGGKAVAAAARPGAAAAVTAARPATAAAVLPKSSVITSIQSSNSMARSPSSVSNDEATPSADFLAWARVALKSVTGVNLDEFLQMLLTFPLNPDPIVMEIISDSVYANSSTLDGRRFAQEFVAKRKADAKAQKAGIVAPVSKGSSLADIVKAKPQAADSGFGAFKVVKKKGKKA